MKREDHIADVRDGLTRAERVVLTCLRELEREFPGRRVPSATLYGRVSEHVSLSQREFQALVRRLTGR